MRFDWDAGKARTNLAKHGVSLKEAESALQDRQAVTRYDDTHSDSEDRYVTIGLSERLRLLFVVHTERHGDTIRIISARRASKSEEAAYAEAQG